MTAEEFKRRYARLFLPRPVVRDPEVDRRFDEARQPPQLALDLDHREKETG